MIEVRNLGKRFGEVVAVDDVSFAARDGQVTGLLGPNGAGKTTTLRVLYGLLRADRGDVLVDDVNVTTQPQDAQRRMGVYKGSPLRSWRNASSVWSPSSIWGPSSTAGCRGSPRESG